MLAGVKFQLKAQRHRCPAGGRGLEHGRAGVADRVAPGVDNALVEGDAKHRANTRHSLDVSPVVVGGEVAVDRIGVTIGGDAGSLNDGTNLNR